MVYNLTSIQTATNPAELITATDNALGGVLIGMLVVVLFFIIMIRMKDYDFEDGLLTSSFVCFILATVFRFAGWVNFYLVLIFLIIFAFTGFGIVVLKRGR